MAFAARRVMRIYPAYWAVLLLLLPVLALRPQWINAASGHNVDLVRSFLLLPQLMPPILPVAWTLTHELYFYLVYGCLIMLPKSLRSRGLALWLAVVAVAYYLKPAAPWYYIDGGTSSAGATYLVISHPATFEFGMGCLAAYLVRQWPLRSLRIVVLMALVSFLCAAVAVSASPELNALTRALLLGGTGSILVLVAVAADLQHTRVLPRWLERVGDISYSVYLIHVLVISAVGRLFHSFDATDPMSQIAFIAITICLIGALGALSYRLVERPAIDAGRMLINRTISRRTTAD